MRPGIFAKTFARESLGATLDANAASGIAAIQFNLALTGGPSLPESIAPRLAAEVASAVRVRGLEMVAVSGTCNLAHPDPGVRRHNLRALIALIAAAPALGTRVVTLCTGSRDADDMWRWHRDNATPEAWCDMLECVQAAIAVAEVHAVTLAFEPEHANVVADARAGRRLLDEVSSPRLKVVIDAANLIRPGELHRQAQTLTAAFELLGEDLVLAHAKDILADGTVVPAGRGGLDYGRYIALLDQVGYSGAVVLHGLGADAVADSLAFLRGQLQSAGVTA